MLGVLSAVLSTFLFLWLLVGEPFVGVHNYHQLAHLVSELPHARATMYVKWMRGKVACLALVALAVLPVTGLPSLGLRLPRPGSGAVLGGLWIAIGIVAGISVLAGVGLARFRFHATTGLERRGRFVPSDRIERLDYALLSFVSGVVEEVLYRGFGIFYLTRFLGMGPALAVLVTAVAFGLAHAYQGWRGVLTMLFLGLGLGFLLISTGSLIPSIVLHVLVDLRVLLIFRSSRRPRLV